MKKPQLLEFFTDVDGSLSFKRLQAIIVLLLFVIVILSNLFFSFSLSGALTELLVFILVYTFTGITIEKFTKRGLTSIAANDQAMLIEAQVNVDQKKIDNAIKTEEKLEQRAEEALEKEEKENKTE